ncbi:PDR/VanB family oxidoreductase [Propylenella binzhouense]|uniref:Oxidoreductase n=1 Tax=Propylenella binzhouense TaxID=2555902 RepID=A0A964T1B4_9HYPH|nr:PDR/VanB family oxidoreductase [Propylenella binzhouense]MYZ46419.1 oxidoreductase [Propylenella binzhouense]
MTDQISTRLHVVDDIADGVRLYDFRPMPGATLPAFSPGSHIDVVLGPELVRSYSLCNLDESGGRYVIAIRRQDDGKGGSVTAHRTLQVGDEVRIRPPRNNFQLIENAEHSVFIAGGIGITPIFAMIQRLEKLKRSWELHYSSPTRRRAAFLAEFEALEEKEGGRVHFHSDDEHGGSIMDLRPILGTYRAGSHYYCCGPSGMIETFESLTGGFPAGSAHLERFSSDVPLSTAGSFEVEFRRLGKSVRVHEGETILQAAINAGADVAFSCEEGVCGSCETAVIEGIPDHQDLVLSKHEREANRKMMICCSRSKTPKLVLDL